MAAQRVLVVLFGGVRKTVFDYGELCAKTERCLAEYSEKGFSAARFEDYTKAIDSFSETPLHAVLETFGCCALERAAVALGFVVSIKASAAERVSRMFGCEVGSITPGAVCGLFCGTDNVSAYADLFSEEYALTRLFSGTSPFVGAAMRIRAPLAVFFLFGEVREKYFSLLEIDMSKEYIAAEKNVEAVIRAVGAYDGENRVTIGMLGENGCGRKTALGLAAARLGIRFALIDSSSAASVPAEETAVLLAAADAYPAVTVTSFEDAAIYDFLNDLSDEAGLMAIVSEETPDDNRLDCDWFPIMPSCFETDVQGKIWRSKSARYPVEKDVDFDEIASEFNLPPGAVEKALRYAAVSAAGKTLSATDIKSGCYLSLSSDMGGRAVRVKTAFTWDELVLPEYSKRLLRSACDRVRSAHAVYDDWGFGKHLPYGRGVSMIFIGPPGTGKTMAAQIVAGELGLELYKVNLAAVVSKYVGETEKNLNDIFDRARKSRVVLFFDEADVLFGKRTEVKDSNDKYNNMEAAFLLQKIEDHNGIVILATNFVQNFDEAFKRRIDFPVEFPFPGKAQRAEIWRSVFPPETPVGKIDLDYLVESLELSGSSIKNIAVYSAFLAAAANDPQIEMKHIISAIRNEFAKSGKAFTKTEAGEYAGFLEE